MEEVFALYDKAIQPDFIGQDVVAKEIFEKSSKISPLFSHRKNAPCRI